MLVGFLLVPSAFAFPGYDGWNVFHDFKKISQNFFEAIAISPEQKQALILQNMAQWQKEKEELISQNIQVPVQYDQTIAEKQESIKNTETDNHFLSEIIDSVLVGQELGKIQSYVNEFHKLKTENIPVDEKSNRVASLEKDVNKLNLVKKHCTYVSVNALVLSDEPYELLVSNYCHVLRDIPKPVVMASVGG